MKYSKEIQNSNKHQNKLGLIDPTVAGIDIGDKVIHVSFPTGKGDVVIKEFETTTPALHDIAKHLKQYGVKTAVMEATGVYWIPLYEILEELGFVPVLVDAKSVKNVPGRKSDVQDCQWIQTLYSNGLLRAAFRPPKDRLKLRSYVRQRQGVIKTKQVALTHMEKALQLMNIKLSTAVSEIGGVSGMDIIRAILKGERNPRKLAALRNKRCKQEENVFVAALTGNFLEEHLFALKQAVNLFDFANRQLAEIDQKILTELESYPTITISEPPRREKDKNKNHRFSACKKPQRNDFHFDVRRLLWQKSGVDFTALPGIEANFSLTLFAELGGTDVSAWKSEKEFASWLKLCPGNNISGGKRRKSKKQPCTSYLNQTFRIAALSAKKSKTAIGAYIRRISGRTDKPKGIKAGAHKIARMFYHMCKYGWQYFEKGEDYYEKEHARRCLKNLEKKAKELGFKLVAA